MRKPAKLLQIAALAVALNEASPATAQNTPTTMQVNRENQPAAGVSIYVLAGANKFSAGMPPTGTTNSTAPFNFPPGLFSASKPHTQMKVYEVCVNGEKVVFVIPKGSEDQLPKDSGGCRKNYLGFFWLDGGPTVIVDLTNGVVTQLGGGPTGSLPQGNPLISVQVGGGVGFKNIGGTSGDRAAFLNSFPGGTFSTSANTFAGDVGSSIGIGPAVFDFTAWRANGSDSKGSGPVLGGGTDTALITQQFQGFSVTGGGKIPMGGKASLIIRGGGNFWHANIDTKETVANGTTSTAVTNSRGVDGRGWTTGAALQVDVSRRWSVVVRYDYLPMNNAGVNVHLNEGSVGVMFRLFGVPGK